MQNFAAIRDLGRFLLLLLGLAGVRAALVSRGREALGSFVGLCSETASSDRTCCGFVSASDCASKFRAVFFRGDLFLRITYMYVNSNTN